MQYFIHLPNEKLDYTTDEWLIGEQSFSNFWPGAGFKKILYAKDNIDKFDIITNTGKIISVGNFIEIIDKLNIQHG